MIISILLDDASVFGALSQIILERTEETENDRVISLLLANSHRFQGITGCNGGFDGHLEHLKKWLEITLLRIEKYNDREDVVVLPLIYNELGLGYLRENAQKEAYDSLSMSCELFPGVTPKDELVVAWPYMNLSRLEAWTGRPEAGEERLMPVIKAREEKYGRDDVTSIELVNLLYRFVRDRHMLTRNERRTGKLLRTLGDIRIVQKRLEDAFDLKTRAVKIIAKTYGENSPVTADTWYQVSSHLVRHGRFSEAR